MNDIHLSDRIEKILGELSHISTAYIVLTAVLRSSLSLDLFKIRSKDDLQNSLSSMGKNKKENVG